MCHNAALVWRRRRSNYRRRIERLGEVGLEPSPALAPDESGREELLAGLYAAIRELAPPDRSLILLSLDGVSYREMAEIHGLSESNVGVRLNRIKQRLAQTLKGQNDDPR